MLRSFFHSFCGLAPASLLVVVSLSAAPLAAQEPEGDEGIAAAHPGDVGIESDPAVLLAESFEDTLANIQARWDDVRNPALMSLSSDVPPSSSGTSSLLMHKTPGDGTTGTHLYTRIVPDGGTGYPALYARMYVRIGAGSDVIHHFGTNLGGNNPPTAWPVVSAGNRPSGDSSFWTGIEPYGDAWRWDFYTYWMEMRSYENPDGSGSTTWGNAFLRDTAAGSWAPVGPVVERGEWICLELMVRVNDSLGERGGEQAFWVNGQLVRRDGQIISHLGPGYPNGSWLRDKWSPEASGSPFEGFRWRSASDLLVNYVWLYVYTEEDSYDIPVWFDDVVVATSYIGPIYRGTTMPRDAGAGTDGGTPGTDAGSAGLDGGSSGADAGAPPPGSDGGCCAVTGADREAPLGLLGIALLIGLRLRQRR